MTAALHLGPASSARAENFAHDVTMHIRQSEIATLEAEGKLFVVNSQCMQDRSAKMPRHHISNHNLSHYYQAICNSYLCV